MDSTRYWGMLFIHYSSLVRGLSLSTRSGMKEAIEGKIEIKEVQYNIFKALLEYIYTNQLPRLKPAVCILYR